MSTGTTTPTSSSSSTSTITGIHVDIPTTTAKITTTNTTTASPTFTVPIHQGYIFFPPTHRTTITVIECIYIVHSSSIGIIMINTTAKSVHLTISPLCDRIRSTSTTPSSSTIRCHISIQWNAFIPCRISSHQRVRVVIIAMRKRCTCGYKSTIITPIRIFLFDQFLTRWVKHRRRFQVGCCRHSLLYISG